MISTSYQPQVALILILTGVCIGIAYGLYELITMRLRVKWLRCILDVLFVIAVYICLSVVIYSYDSGRVRGYTALTLTVGVLIGGLVKKYVVILAKVLKKSLTKPRSLSHNSRGD